MNISEYQQMSEMEKTYWWHVGRMEIVKSVLAKNTPNSKLKILNVGCGTGGTIPHLEEFGKVTNVDTSKEAVKFLKEKGYSGKLYNGKKLPFKENSFDLVVALDVLEHIKEDGAALDEWKRVLKPNGGLLITVPAHQWLWSGHDEALHHFRRYTRKGLRKLLVSADFSVRKASYAIAFSLPLIVGFRFLNKLLGKKMDSQSSYIQLPGFVNKFFIFLLKVEAKMQKLFNMPFGTSVISYSKKKP